MKGLVFIDGSHVVSFHSKDNAETFCRFFSNSTDSLIQKILRPKNKFGIKTAGEQYYKQIRNECKDFDIEKLVATIVNKILKNLDVVKASGIDQISDKVLLQQKLFISPTLYSGICLKRTPSVQKNLSTLDRCPLYREFS